MEQTVIGIFRESASAARAEQELERNGFSQADVDVSVRSGTSMGTNTVASTETDRDTTDDSFGERVERFFRNLFDTEDESTKYATAAKSGTVVSVRVQSREEAERVADILDDAGAIDVDESSRTQSASHDYTGTLDERSAGMDTTSRSIPVVEEELQVGKREVATGGVRVRSRIIEKPVEETLRLRQERISVERTPTDRPATEGDFSTFEEGQIEMTETEEVPVVKKEARVVEEVRLKKDVREREEVIRDTVRRKDVEIDETDETGTDSSMNKRRND